ncbi:MAG: hypothetical protein ACXWQX_08985 [Bdellovibrio sp.]
MTRILIILLLNTFLTVHAAYADSKCLFPENINLSLQQTNSSFDEDPLNFCFGDFDNQKSNNAFRIDEYCDLINVKTQCREKFKKILKKNGCSYKNPPVVCDLESQIRKLGHAPEKFTCAYFSSNCYTIQNSQKDLCAAGFAAVSIPSNKNIKLCANRRTNPSIDSNPAKGKR